MEANLVLYVFGTGANFYVLEIGPITFEALGQGKIVCPLGLAIGLLLPDLMPA